MITVLFVTTITGGTHAAARPPIAESPAASLAEHTSVSLGDKWLFTDAAGVNRSIDEVADLGARGVRIDVRWALVQPGSAADQNWSQLDLAVDRAVARGLKIIGILCTSPTWARPSGTLETWGPATPTQRAQFGDFAQAAAERYAGKIQYWEVWNEPNLQLFWTNPSVANFGALLSSTAPRIRAGSPGATIISGGTGGAGGSAKDINSLTWYQQLYQLNGIRDTFDVAAVHPYVDIFADGSADPASGEMARAAQIKTLIDQVDPATPLWATELGAPSGGEHSVTEARHATLLSQMIDRWLTISPGQWLAVYTMNDNPNQTNREDYFGLKRPDGSLKPAYEMLQDRLTTCG